MAARHAAQLGGRLTGGCCGAARGGRASSSYTGALGRHQRVKCGVALAAGRQQFYQQQHFQRRREEDEDEDEAKRVGGGHGGFMRAGQRRRVHVVPHCRKTAVDYIASLPKSFEPCEREAALYARWEATDCFAPTSTSSSSSSSSEHEPEPFTVAMPPPNVTGRLHMGHAMFVTLQDVMVRHARMQGRPTLWLPGADHAGIATQLVVERALRAEGLTRVEIGRDAFEARVWRWKEQYGGFITEQMRRLGASCDWGRERFTLDEGLSAAVVEAFMRLHEKGLVYRGSYMVNWSPNLMTAVSDLEVEYTEETGTLFHFKYPIVASAAAESSTADGDVAFLPVATSRPETILGDTAVAVNPNDDRYRHLIGRECEVPMSGGRKVPIIGDEYVDMEFGSGALKITPGHDPNDYELGKRHDLPIITIMNRDGTMNDAAAKYMNKDRLDARAAIWEDLQASGLAIRTESYATRVPRSQRGGEVIEPMVSKQWFVKMEPLAQKGLAAVDDGSIRIVPERFRKIYDGWLSNIKDWCISRQLWWGHRIPVWYVHDSRESCEQNPTETERFVVARNESEAHAEARQRYGDHVYLAQDPDVLDTWFSSGLWPFSTLGWPDESSADYARFYPTTVMETGHDILFFWVSRMIMMGLEFTGKPPFSVVYLHGLVRDEQGRKMSKSLGNVVDPLDVIEKSGTDALRYTLATGTSVGQDLNLSMDRVDASRNFTNKIWNASRFVLSQLTECTDEEWERLGSSVPLSESEIAELPLSERWIVSKTHEVAAGIDAKLTGLEIAQAGRDVYEFFWNDFADWYIEASKTRMYGDDTAAAARTRRVLVYVLSSGLRLLHPFMPFVTEELWTAMPHSGQLVSQRLPGYEASPGTRTQLAVDTTALENFEIMQDIVRGVRATRSEYNAPPGRRIAAVLFAKGDSLRQSIEDERGVFCSLAKLDIDNLDIRSSAPDEASMEDFVQIIIRDGVSIALPLSGLADAEKEIVRLHKQLAKLEKDLTSLEGRLGSKNFVDKAPANVVADVRAQASELGEQRGAIKSRIEQMERLAAGAAIRT